MRTRAWIIAGGWVLATAAATGLSWTGVDVVTHAVAASPDPVLAGPRIRSALSALPGGPGPLPPGAMVGGRAPVPPDPGSLGYPPAAGSAEGSPGARASGSPSPAGAGSNAGGAVPGSPGGYGAPATSGGPGSGRPSGLPLGSAESGSGSGDSSSSSGTAPATTRTFANPGGQLTVSCSGAQISLDSATPADGYQAEVLDAGPEQVRVRFSGSGQVYPMAAACRSGSPVMLRPDGSGASGGSGPSGSSGRDSGYPQSPSPPDYGAPAPVSGG